eukprot:Opistho-2@36621
MAPISTNNDDLDAAPSRAVSHRRPFVREHVALFVDGALILLLWFTAGGLNGSAAEGAYLRASVVAFTFRSSLFDAVALSLGRNAIIAAILVGVARHVTSGGRAGDPAADRHVRAATATALVLSVGTLCFLATKTTLVALDNGRSLSGSAPVGLTLLGLATFASFGHVVLAVTLPTAARGLVYRNELDDDNNRELAGETADRRAKGSVNIMRLVRMARPELWINIAALVALAASSAAVLVVPSFFGKIIDAVSEEGDREELNRSVIILVLIFAGGSVATFFRGWLFTLSGQRLVARMRRLLFAKIMEQEIAFFDSNRTGELINRLASDATVVQDAITVNFSMLARYAVQVVGCLILMFILSWKLTAVMLSVVPVVAFGAVAYGKYVRRLRAKFQDELAVSSSVAEESFGNARTVRSFSSEDKATAAYGNGVERSLHVGQRLALASGTFQGAIGMLAQSAIALVLWYGDTLVLDGDMSAGKLTSFVLYTLTLAMAFAFISSLYGEFMQAIGASARIFELLDRKPSIPTRGGDRFEGDFKGHIAFENVRFRYPSRDDVEVLRGVSFRVEPGQVCALVGPSGQGKSTIIALLERFYDPTEGRILLDKMPLSSMDPSWVHTQIALVSQEPVLFCSSIAENISYGRANATRDEIIEAAKLANAHEFILSSGEGYETLVGERGVRLSGGQKQRIAIARALIMNPKILLDEATSALDAESEHLVQEAIDRAMLDRTVLVIAHRLSTVRNASKILVINNGSIIEEGTHDELIANEGGTYMKLVRRQMHRIDG